VKAPNANGVTMTAQGSTTSDVQDPVGINNEAEPSAHTVAPD
jgi:hypothetical protein